VEHEVVARLLAPKRLRRLTGASTRFGHNGARCPLDYYAVRDPSVVRVIPVKRPPMPNGFRHVKLSFQMTGLSMEEALEQLRRGPDAGGMDSTAAFVMTIGLPVAEEESFFQRAVAVEPNQDFTDLYTRIRDLGSGA
jgi:hypothetical protein